MNIDPPLRDLAQGILRAVAENALVIDGDLRIIAVSTGMGRILDAPYQGSFEESLGRVISPSHHRLLMSLIRQALEGETHLPSVSISIAHERMRASARSVLQQPPLVVFTLIHVEEGENPLHQLKHVQERYDRTLNTGKVAIWEWDLRQHQLKIEPDIYTFLPLDPSIPAHNPRSWRQIYHPEDVPKVQEAVTACIHGERDQFEIQVRVRTSRGTVRWFLIRGSVASRLAGRPIFISGTALDITETRNTMEALRQSEERFATAFQMSPAPLVIASLETGIARDVNAAFLKLLGLSREEVIGRTASQIGINIDPNFRQRLMSCLETEGYAKDIETLSRTSSGEIRHTLVSGALINYGGERCYMTLTYDITDRKRYEEEMLKRSIEHERVKLLEHFIADASHDLRTPLTVLSTSSYLVEQYAKSTLRTLGMIRATNPSDGQVIHHTQELNRMVSTILEQSLTIKTHTNRLSDIVERMLELVRLDKQPAFHFAPVNLNNMIEDLLLLFENRAYRSAITLSASLEPLPLASVDRGELSRAIQNILENAFNYTPKGGKVEVCAHRDGAFAVISISDTGIGIRPDDLPHIFSRFFRSDPARETHQSGSGLGLAIAQKVIQAHQGRIEVQSEVGKGTTFHLIFPFQHEQPPEQNKAP